MSSDRDADNLQVFLAHLQSVRFTGLVNISFREGALVTLSRKDELTPDGLDRFLHRPVVIKRKKPEKAETAPPEPPAETLNNP